MRIPIYASLILSMLTTVATAHAADRPNVLVISIDDLNDWTGCLGGHPQARTPHIDRLAERGVLFRNAHCQAPICTPSRASLVTGLYPSTTGLYFLQPRLESSDVATRRPDLLEQFAIHGYRTLGAGKFVSGGGEGKYYQQYGGGMGGFGPLPESKLSGPPEGHKLWDWGPYPEDESRMPDVKIADWVIDKLNQTDEKPFFLVAGFWRPHVPMYAPPPWFELFPLEEIQLPLVKAGDRDDLSQYAKTLTVGLPAPRHQWFVEHNAWRGAVQAYLASVAFVDHCVGRVLDALQASEHNENTIVVLFSDHGWHLGEKEHWAKRTLWNDATRVPLIVSAPGVKGGSATNRPVGLIDLFPTLLELADLPPREDLEGKSLAPLLADPNAKWDRPVLTTFGPGNHSLRGERWHYIRYGDGSKELYDHQRDPHEWHNLAAEANHRPIIDKMLRWLPTQDAEPKLSPRRVWEVDAWREAEKLRPNSTP